MLDVCSCMLDVITIVPHDLGRIIFIFPSTWGWMKVKESAEAFDQAFAHTKEAAAENVSTSSVSLFPSA